MLQATILDCLFFDLFPFSDDVFVSSEVDIRWCDVAHTFMVTMVIVILDECLDLLFKVAGQIIVFQKDAVFHGLEPSLDFTLSLGMEQLTGTQDCKLTVTGKDVEQSEKHLAWNGHGFDVSDDVREAKLGATQKLVLELIRETPHCTQKFVVDTIGKDQGQVAKAINRLIELGLIVKKGVQLSAQ